MKPTKNEEVKTFRVLIEEVLAREVEVEADTKEEAEKKVREMYCGEEIVLDWSDCQGTSIKAIED